MNKYNLWNLSKPPNLDNDSVEKDSSGIIASAQTTPIVTTNEQLHDLISNMAQASS